MMNMNIEQELEDNEIPYPQSQDEKLFLEILKSAKDAKDGPNRFF
jgi:hypothetical protein